jgi:hypothetical protein
MKSGWRNGREDRDRRKKRRKEERKEVGYNIG